MEESPSNEDQPKESVPPAGLERSNSTASLVESTKSYDSDEFKEDITYTTAPHDIVHESPRLGKIFVVRMGDKVPCTTKYKKTKKGGALAIRYR